jgi:hypothetical protein
MVSKKLLLVMVQAKNHRDVALKVLVEGVRTVTPHWLWKSKSIKVCIIFEFYLSNNLTWWCQYKTAAESVFPQGAPSNADELAPRTHDALRNIPSGLTVKNAEYPILRVFASWPGDAKLDRTTNKPSKKKSSKKNAADEEEKTVHEEDLLYDVDRHPLAALHMDNFKSLSRQMGVQWFCSDVQRKEVIHAKRSAGSVSLDMRKSKRAREEPREDVEVDDYTAASGA